MSSEEEEGNYFTLSYYKPSASLLTALTSVAACTTRSNQALFIDHYTTATRRVCYKRLIVDNCSSLVQHEDTPSTIA